MERWELRDLGDLETALELAGEAGEPGLAPENPWVHPTGEQLRLFMAGRLGRTESRRVVRHLLEACPLCRSVTSRVWRLADEPVHRSGRPHACR